MNNAARADASTDYVTSPKDPVPDQGLAAGLWTQRQPGRQWRISQNPDSGKPAPTAGLQDYLSRHNFQSTQPEQPVPFTEGNGSWTVFVNLSANMRLLNGALRIDDELQQQKLIDMTRDKPIKIIVQTTLDHYANMNGMDKVSGAYPATRMSPDPEDTSIVRYEISNGQKRLLSKGDTQGMSADLQGLLAADPDAWKADHVALFDEAHGLNLKGFEGDSGTMTVPEFESVVAQALQRQGRSSLDLLDLTACDMSSAQTISELGRVAKLIVSSEEEEYLYPSSSELLAPLSEPIAQLIAQPQMSPLEFGQQIIQTNADTCRLNAHSRIDKGRGNLHLCGANTLGLYDGAATPALTTAINHLGTALTDASTSAQNKSAIDQITQALPKVYGDSTATEITGSDNDQQKDLVMLVTQLENGLARGTVKDTAGGDIRHALAEVKSAMSSVVVAHFNSSLLGLGLPQTLQEHGYPNQPLSGVSVFLPKPMSQQAQRIGAREQDTFDLLLTGEKLRLDALIGRPDFDYASSDMFRTNLKVEQKELQTLASSLTSTQSIQDVSHFQQSASKLSSWLESAHNLSLEDRTSQYADLQKQFSTDLKALILDTRAWQEMGLHLARQQNTSQFQAGIDDPQSAWSRFVTGLSEQ